MYDTFGSQNFINKVIGSEMIYFFLCTYLPIYIYLHTHFANI